MLKKALAATAGLGALVGLPSAAHAFVPAVIAAWAWAPAWAACSSAARSTTPTTRRSWRRRPAPGVTINGTTCYYTNRLANPVTNTWVAGAGLHDASAIKAGRGASRAQLPRIGPSARWGAARGCLRARPLPIKRPQPESARAFLAWGADVQENPDRQSRRNRLPGHQDGAPHGHQDRRRLFRSRQGRAACRDGRRGGRHRPARGGAVLSRDRQDRRGLQGDGRRGGPSGLRLPVRARGFRPRARRGGRRLHRPQPQSHRGDGRQDRIRRNSPTPRRSRPCPAISA